MVRDYLKRLDDAYYQSDAIVHWSIAIRDRRVGWLSDSFHLKFRELVTHTIFRYQLACPIYCLMPDHMHLLWMGLSEASDQRIGMKHFRKSANATLGKIGFELQDQAYDHVLHEGERRADGFRQIVEYIARNPERAKLVAEDCYSDYPFTGCLVPGYPELELFSVSFWTQFDRIVSFLRRNGVLGPFP